MAEETTRPAWVCEECGGVNEDAAARVKMLEQQLGIVQENVELAERDLRSKRAQITRLQREQDQRVRNHPKFEGAMRVLAHWRTVCSPNARELAGKRLENCIARMVGG